jgi:SAM-dependent methyltransferase
MNHESELPMTHSPATAGCRSTSTAHETAPAGLDRASIAHRPAPTALRGSKSAPGAHGLYLPEADFRFLFTRLGPSLGLWRAAEIAALREQAQLMAPPVLDLGCGDGLVTSLVLPRVAIGLDPDTRALNKAIALGIYERMQPVAIEHALLPPGSVGTVISNSVLEHVSDLDAALAAAARLLGSGGRLIVTTPTDAFGSWLVVPTGGYADWRNRQLAHLNLWPVATWSERLARAGLEVESVRPYLRKHLVTAWDALELLQQVRAGGRRVFGMAWRRLPSGVVAALARRAARLDLSAPPPGGGRLVIARKI